MENLILSTHNVDYNKFLQQRGSVPTIPSIFQERQCDDNNNDNEGDHNDEESCSSTVTTPPELNRSQSEGELNDNIDSAVEIGETCKEEGGAFTQCTPPQSKKNFSEASSSATSSGEKCDIVVTCTGESDLCIEEVVD